MQKDIHEIKTDVKAIGSKIDKKFEEFTFMLEAKLANKADKWTELAMKWAIGIIIGIVLSAMVAKVII
jgi:hypothetical protein